MLQKTPFGYSRKDVILIGLGVTFLGIGLKSGLEVHLAQLCKQKYVSNVFSFVISCCSRMEWISCKIDIMYVKEMRLMM